jgi:hypothetical protein
MNAQPRQHDAAAEQRYARVFILIGRLLLTLAFLSLCSAWISQLTGGSRLGMTQQHLFNDSMALSLIGIGSLLGGLLHSKGM